MKSLKLLVFVFVSIFSLLATTETNAATVQIIHNCADAAAKKVDVWVNNVRTVQNLEFRKATTWTPIQALSVTIAITTPGAVDTTKAIFNKTYAMDLMKRYVIVANGIVSASGYNPKKTFEMSVFEGGKITSTDPNKTDILVLHGSTDAPAVDIWETKVTNTKLVSNISYSQFQGYLSLPAEDYALEVRTVNSTEAIAKYDVPLKTLQAKGFALVVFASGFFDPTKNSNGDAFGLYAALPTGDVIALPPANTLKYAKAQIIHNCADKAAESVDIWVNNSKAFAGVKFREATAYTELPAGFPLSIAVTAAKSNDTVGAVKQFNITLEPETRNILVASGIVSSTGYAPIIPFDLKLYNMGKEKATNPEKNEVLTFHGVTDAPPVDLSIENANQTFTSVISNAFYGEFYAYTELPFENLKLKIYPAGSQELLVTYLAPFNSLNLKGETFVLLASGFADPTQNSNATPFGIIMVKNDGTVIELMPEADENSAKVQIIHNSADKAVETVDIWVGNQKAIPNFKFRTATPYIDFPSDVEIVVSIALPNAKDTSEAIAKYKYTLVNGAFYTIIANGIVSPTGYNPATPFDLYVSQSRIAALNSENIDLMVFHGSTDAPTIDIYEKTAGELINDLSYGKFSNYLELPQLDYLLQLRDATGTTILKKYLLPFKTEGMKGLSTTIVASGFLDSTKNSNGQPFQLLAVTEDGFVSVIDEESINSVEYTANNTNSNNVMPNPSIGVAIIKLDLNNISENLVLTVFDTNGQKVYSQDFTNLTSGTNYINLNLPFLTNGVYRYTAKSAKDNIVGSFTVVK